LGRRVEGNISHCSHSLLVAVTFIFFSLMKSMNNIELTFPRSWGKYVKLSSRLISVFLCLKFRIDKYTNSQNSQNSMQINHLKELPASNWWHYPEIRKINARNMQGRIRIYYTSPQDYKITLCGWESNFWFIFLLVCSLFFSSPLQKSKKTQILTKYENMNKTDTRRLT